ncbi:VOC family protein [Pendulispora rubella]|uniref:VOC family protein n=1 Tax=Pendulispora rubella TaxID=2741070 RepID=A0ABZ2KS67_9BACT
MEIHRGRLIDHIQLRCADFAASKRFYAAILAVFSRELVELAPWLVYADELCLSPAEKDPPSHIHIAFQAADRAEVDRVHAAALGAGGRDNGKPGERHYHPGYYAAFLLDPDGNNIEVVYHGEGERSAPSVVIRPKLPV